MEQKNLLSRVLKQGQGGRVFESWLLILLEEDENLLQKSLRG